MRRPSSNSSPESHRTENCIQCRQCSELSRTIIRPSHLVARLSFPTFSSRAFRRIRGIDHPPKNSLIIRGCRRIGIRTRLVLAYFFVSGLSINDLSVGSSTAGQHSVPPSRLVGNASDELAFARRSRIRSRFSVFRLRLAWYHSFVSAGQSTVACE